MNQLTAQPPPDKTQADLDGMASRLAAAGFHTKRTPDGRYDLLAPVEDRRREAPLHLQLHGRQFELYDPNIAQSFMVNNYDELLETIHTLRRIVRLDHYSGSTRSTVEELCAAGSQYNGPFGLRGDGISRWTLASSSF